MDSQGIIQRASAILETKVGHRFNQLEIAKPKSQFEAINLLKIWFLLMDRHTKEFLTG